MFARGVLSLHTACPERSAFFAPRVLHRGRRAPVSVPKTPASKSPVSITSKLIETKALQILYSGHLRKTGGYPLFALRKMSACRHLFALCLQSPLSVPFFSITCTLFHFPYHTYPLSLQHLPHSFTKNPGVPPLAQPIALARTLSALPFACPARSRRVTGRWLPVTRHFPSPLATGRGALVGRTGYNFAERKIIGGGPRLPDCGLPQSGDTSRGKAIFAQRISENFRSGLSGVAAPGFEGRVWRRLPDGVAIPPRGDQ